jgi:hypothetical protein
MSSIVMRAAIVVLAMLAPVGHGQERAIAPDLGKVAEGKGWRIHNALPTAMDVDGRRAVRLEATGDSANGIAGLALVDAPTFRTGTLEIELKGKNVRQRSFLGVAFNVTGERNFEAVYFRPFNFNAEGEFRRRAVQYIAWPENTWERLRKEQPGRFEAAVDPVPDPDGWFRARIEVGQTQVRVYVNDSKQPSLTVDRLAEGGKARPLGLFVDSSDGLYANLRISPTP